LLICYGKFVNNIVHILFSNLLNYLFVFLAIVYHIAHLFQILYTGDFSRQEDRHLMGAETPHVSPHVLIVESTYGVQVHEPRVTREQLFTCMLLI